MGREHCFYTCCGRAYDSRLRFEVAREDITFSPSESCLNAEKKRPLVLRSFVGMCLTKHVRALQVSRILLSAFDQLWSNGGRALNVYFGIRPSMLGWCWFPGFVFLHSTKHEVVLVPEFRFLFFTKHL